jgi:hypothetical protein
MMAPAKKKPRLTMADLQRLPDDVDLVANCFIGNFHPDAWLGGLEDQQLRDYKSMVEMHRGSVRQVTETVRFIQPFMALEIALAKLEKRKAAVATYLAELIAPKLERYERGVWSSMVRSEFRRRFPNEDMDL